MRPAHQPRALTLASYLLILVFSAGTAHAQNPGAQSFQVEWQMRSGEHFRPGIEGYIYNHSSYRVGNVRLKVEVLDATNRVIREQFGWVYGAIDAGGRGYFTLKPLRPDETCRITVESFDLLSRQSP